MVIKMKAVIVTVSVILLWLTGVVNCQQWNFPIQNRTEYVVIKNITYFNHPYNQTNIGWNVPSAGIYPVQPLGYVPPGQQSPGYRPQVPLNVLPQGPFVNRIHNETLSSSGNLFVGNPGPNDIVIFKETFVKGPRLFQIRDKVIHYPERPITNGKYATITAIHITNLNNNNNNSHAQITGGGVGYNVVSIHLSSARNKGFNYKIVIYGHY